jgi:hypothetical protein
VFLAGIAGVLGTNLAARLLDDPEYDVLLVALWAIAAGGIHGLFLYFVVGGLVYLGASFAGSLGSYRRARHVVGYAAAPLALSLLVWPVRIATYGGDSFRRGGSDTGAANRVFEALEVGFLAWAVALVVIGVRTVHGWTWARALAASSLAIALPALALARAFGLL